MPPLDMPDQQDKPLWQKKTIDFDARKWPHVKFLVASNKQTIREWLDVIISEAILRAGGR
jgi:hypothetical protein